MAIPNTGDSGYYSEANVQGVTAAGLDPYFAVGRQKHHAPEAQPPAGDSAATPKDAMARKLQTPTGRALYAARKHIVEPVFGQIKHLRGFRKSDLRGRDIQQKPSTSRLILGQPPSPSDWRGLTKRKQCIRRQLIPFSFRRAERLMAEKWASSGISTEDFSAINFSAKFPSK